MEKMTLKKLIENKTIRNISVLRTNQNGLPYVTAITPDSKSNNLYFSISTGKLVMDNFNEGQQVLEFLAEAEIIKTENAQGEVRYKLFRNLNSKYASDAELERIFGVEVSDSKFNLVEFKKLFVGKDQLVKSGSPVGV